jgi:hypothetical protein
LRFIFDVRGFLRMFAALDYMISSGRIMLLFSRVNSFDSSIILEIVDKS